MTPDWPELWAREPGLRPFDDDEMLDLAALRGGSPLARWPDSIWERVMVRAQRDAAVRWLAKRGGLQIADRRVFILWMGPPPEGLCETIFDEQQYLALDAGSLDASLFAACKAFSMPGTAHARSPNSPA